MLLFKKAILTFAISNTFLAPYEMPFLVDDSTLISSIDPNTKIHSSVENDLEKMNFDLSKAKDDSLLTITRSDEFVYFYFKLSVEEVKSIKAVISYSNTLVNDLYEDEFYSFNLDVVSTKEKIYKAVSTSENLLKTKRINVNSILYNDNKYRFDINQTFIFNENEVSNVLVNGKIKIINPYTAYFTLKTGDNYHNKYYNAATVLNYMFFDTSIDEKLDKVTDRITDVTVNYIYKNWSCKEADATSFYYPPSNICAMSYDELKNSSFIYDFTDGEEQTKIESINEKDNISVESKYFWGTRTYHFDCLFETSKSTDEWVTETNKKNGNHRWGLMFYASTQTYHYFNSMDFNPSAKIKRANEFSSYYEFTGTHVEQVKILTISYIDDGIAYKNVAVYDTYHNLVNGGYVDSDKTNHEDELNDFFKMVKMITDFFNNIGAFFVSIGTWFANNPWAFYSILALILLLILSPLINKLINLFKRRK